MGQWTRRTGVLLLVWRCYGASISIPDQAATLGQTAPASISFSASRQAVAAIQFDLSWDPALRVKILPGATLGASSKVLFTALTGVNGVRCLVAGYDAQPLADGEILRVWITSGGAEGTWSIRSSNATAVDADGTELDVNAGTAIVQTAAGDPTQSLQQNGVLNLASLTSGPIAPGEMLSITGFFTPGAPPNAVQIGGLFAPVFSATETEVQTAVPFGLAPNAPASIAVLSPQFTIQPLIVPVTLAAPAILTQSAAGLGPGAILNEDATVNSFSNPAGRNTTISVFGTGFGGLTPTPQDGQIVTAPDSTNMQVTATIGGVPAQVISAGSSQGVVAGLQRIDLVVPADAQPSMTAPIVLQVGGVSTAPGVTVAIR